jgi:lambda family phage minor tail protein L
MSIIFEELLNSSPFAIIELYELETFAKIHGAANNYYFFAGHNKEDNPAEIVFNGNTYLALPIEADGFEYKGDGGLPRPTVRIANLQSSISAILLGINEFNFGNDLIGARFTRVRTLSRFLDGSNWESGTNPYGTPNPNETMPNEIYYVDRKVSENRDFVEFELVSSFDMAGVRAPKRQALSNLCQWEYKSKECGYTGSDKFNEDDTVITAVSAPGYTYTSGADVLSSGVFLQENEELVSSNGWFRLALGSDGNLAIHQKPPTDETVIWSTNSVDSPGGGGNYQLRMALNGNLPIDRNDNIGEFIWLTGTQKIGDVKTGTGGVTFSNWSPTDARGGRPGAFGYEVVVIDGGGSLPTAAGQTSATYSVTFTQTRDHYGNGNGLGTQTRSITIDYTFSSGELASTHYSGVQYSWNNVVSASVTASTGLWQDGETFLAEKAVSSSNPFRYNPKGEITTIGASYAITADNWNGVYQLKLRNDGRIEIQNSGGSRVIWRSSNGAVTTEPTINAETSAPDQDVCGKRLSSCRKRFPNGKDDHGGLPFGSFPGVGTVR